MALVKTAAEVERRQRDGYEEVALVSARPQIDASLPAKQRTADAHTTQLEGAFQNTKDAVLLTDEVKAYYDRYASGGAQSMSVRSVNVQLENSDERFTLGASVSCKVSEVKEMIGSIVQVDADKLRVWRNTGRKMTIQADREEVASNIIVTGIESFRRVSKRRYRHPLAIMGAGLGGLQTAIVLKSRGREDFVIFDRCEDFGGASWICCANKYTKLQTERGTYHLDYIIPDAAVPKEYGDTVYKTWPSRDMLLKMFRHAADKHGLRDKTRFNTSIVKIQVQQNSQATARTWSAAGSQADEFDRSYILHTIPVHVSGEQCFELGDAEAFIGSACICWPGNLTKLNLIDFPGEDAFGGYIEYSSFDRADYTQATGKNVILYGHGAFVIENVRTLLEHFSKKVYVMCRKRNICGMRAVSWIVGYEEAPIPGHIMLHAMQRMYDLVDFDVWSAHSVKTDANHTFAYIEQKTVFGVTDIYFLAGYFGLMEVVVDEIKRLSYHCAHCLRSGRKLEDVEVIVKAIGTLPDLKIQKLLNFKELVGVWVNGDPLMPISTNGMFVAAKNFGSFSSGPGFVGVIMAHVWFIDFPDDWKLCVQHLPVAKKQAGKPSFIPSGPHAMTTFMTLQGILPGLAVEMGRLDRIKWQKQQATHPPKEFIAECTKEWNMYCKTFRDAGMVDDRPDPPYPYTVEIMEDYMQQNRDHWVKMSQKGKPQ